MAVRAFSENFCDLCQKVTFWYLSTGEAAPGHCTNHCKWEKDVVHAVPPIVQGANLSSTELQEARKGLNETELRNANRINTQIWAKTVEARKHTHYLPNTPAFAGIADTLRNASKESVPADPDAICCFQCGKPISKITATSEVKPQIKQVLDPDQCFKDADGKQHIGYKTKVTAREVHACSDCCLSIRKPISVRIV